VRHCEETEGVSIALVWQLTCQPLIHERIIQNGIFQAIQFI